jgi:hypothetical protein
MNQRFLSLACGLVSAAWLFTCAGGQDTGRPSAGGSSTGQGGGGPVLGSGGASGTISLPPPGAGGQIISIDASLPPQTCTSDCTDFPTDPIIDPGTPANASDMFAQPAAGAGPCILEPQDGSMLPATWLRPRVHVTGKASVYQITFHADIERNDLVAYTTRDTWILPKDIWTKVAGNVQEKDITVTVRGSSGAGAPTESVTKFQVAPVVAGGSMVFWGSLSTDPGLTTSALYGFAPGDEGVVSTLTPGLVQGPILDDSPVLKRALPANSPGGAVPAGQVRCIGCHASTPAGDAVAITDHWPWNIKIVSIRPGEAGKQPDYVTPMGALIAQLPWQGTSTFSPGFWGGANDVHVYISSLAPRSPVDPNNPSAFWNTCPGGVCDKTNKDDLWWVNLGAPGTPPDVTSSQASNTVPAAIYRAKTSVPVPGWGVLARTGDTRGALTPSWTHSGDTIAYTSTDATLDGRIGTATVCDIDTVPFANGAGGPATPLHGASDPVACEYYPNYSADDKYVAFNRVANPVRDKTNPMSDANQVYYRPDGEIWITRADGAGDAIRLVANDPPQCSGEASPGVLNSWPKWSPLARTANGKTYYFLIFSSARQTPGLLPTTGQTGNKDRRISSLYMATVVDDGSGAAPKTYPAVYLWNQRYLVSGDVDGGDPTFTALDTSNVTPAWNDFQIPPVPPITVIIK